MEAWINYTEFRRQCFTRPHSLRIFPCGSFNELPMLYRVCNPTDIDVIFYHYEICAIPWNRKPPKNFQGTTLKIVSNEETPPGFVKLKICRDTPFDGSMYFHRPNFLKSIGTSTGPAIKRKADNPMIKRNRPISEHGKLQPERDSMKHDGKILHDFVYGIYCPYWPPEAGEWKNRKRNYGWPDEALIARIVSGGCHFVSKSPTVNVIDDSVWRFSFSKAELILIHSWTNIQKHVYHVVRLIKTEIAKKCSRGEYKSLQTYYFKTLMFWLCEEKPSEYWSKSNIETCVCEILGRMIKCLNDRHCPLYFIREVNILNHLENNDFSEELTGLVTFIEKYAKKFIGHNIYICQFFHQLSVYSDLMFEGMALASVNSILPMYKELSGRLEQYLAECEWFLPEMVFLHRAVEANLRVMTIENAASRSESEDCKTCLENFQLALSNTRYLEPTLILNCHLSFDEIVREHLLSRKSKQTIRIEIQNAKETVYLRKTGGESSWGTKKHIKDLTASMEQMLREHPLPLQCVTTAYKANFYFTALRSYDLAYHECTQCLEAIEKLQPITEYPEHCLSLLISTKLASIFDEHVQAIIGFVTLLKFCTSKSTSTTIWPEVSLHLSTCHFLEYIEVQCERKLRDNCTQMCYHYPEFSDITLRNGLMSTGDNEDLSNVIFCAALRQSGADAKFCDSN